MAIVYGYFRSETQARQAARRCEEMGVTSAVLDSVEFTNASMGTGVSHETRNRELLIVRSGLIGAAVFGILGFVIWFILPGLHNKLFLAGPLMAALYGAGVGVAVGMWYGPRAHRVDEGAPAGLLTHPAADRVVVVNVDKFPSMISVEELLESEGAIEVIHRAA